MENFIKNVLPFAFVIGLAGWAYHGMASYEPQFPSTIGTEAWDPTPQKFSIEHNFDGDDRYFIDNIKQVCNDNINKIIRLRRKYEIRYDSENVKVIYCTEYKMIFTLDKGTNYRSASYRSMTDIKVYSDKWIEKIGVRLD